MLSILVGIIVLAALIYFLSPKAIRFFFLEFQANRFYKIDYKNLEKEIGETRKELKSEKSDKGDVFILKGVLKDLEKFKDEVDETRKKYIELSERFKFDPKKRAQIVVDWGDYASLFNDICPEPEAREFLQPSMKEIEENYIRRQEIIKRFDKMLSAN